MSKKSDCQRFIKSIQMRKSVTGFYLYKLINSEHYHYYFSINGYLNDKYFSVDLTYSKISGMEEIRIPAHVTDCVEEIETILKKFNLL